MKFLFYGDISRSRVPTQHEIFAADRDTNTSPPSPHSFISSSSISRPSPSPSALLLVISCVGRDPALLSSHLSAVHDHSSRPSSMHCLLINMHANKLTGIHRNCWEDTSDHTCFCNFLRKSKNAILYLRYNRTEVSHIRHPSQGNPQ